MSLLTALTFVNPVSAAEVIIPDYGIFGGTSIEGSTFKFPTGAQGWGGFVALDSETEPYYPFRFNEAGQITVMASVPDGGDATIRFKFENAPHPDTEPSIDNILVNLSGASEQTVSVPVPAYTADTEQTFGNLVFFITERNRDINITDIQVVSDDFTPPPPPPPPADAGAASETTLAPGDWNIFGFGEIIEQVGSDYQFEFPSDAEDYGGFAVSSTVGENVYPFSFQEDGSVVFTASMVNADTTATVYFNFERKPYPDTVPNYQTSSITLNSTTPQTFTIPVPSQGSNTYESLNFYIEERDVRINLGDVVINDDAGLPEERNKVYFVLEEVNGPDKSYWMDSNLAEVITETPQSYQVTIPANEANPENEYIALVLRIVGPDQSIAINDVKLNIGGNVYGETDGLIFDTAFGGEAGPQEVSGDYVYTHVNGSGGGFLINQAGLDLLEVGAETLAQEATVTFTAYLTETPSDVVKEPIKDGETAILSNGIIDTSEDTGTGVDGDPPFKWSAHVAWYPHDDPQGTEVGSDDWGQLYHLPATWDNGVLTLGPNTHNFNSPNWSVGDDGAYHLIQTFKIEGTTGSSAILGKTVTFSGTIDSNTLPVKSGDRYEVKAFVKALDPSTGFTTVEIDEQVLTTGNFIVSADLPAGNFAPQFGFTVTGRNANPDSDWGEIKISNIVASYDETTPINEGTFSNGSNGYWGFTAGADFTTPTAYGSIPGAVELENTTTTPSDHYIVSNQNNYEDISNFGLEAGLTYDFTYYMNLLNGSNYGGAQFLFVNDAVSQWEYTQYDNSGLTDDDGDNWVQASHTITVPEFATKAKLYVISGAQSNVVFDHLNIIPVLNFNYWANSNSLTGSNAAFSADPDGDGMSNGLESFLGTDPSTTTSPLSMSAISSNGFSIVHPRNTSLTDDISASYYWSTDLQNWNASGAASNGTTVEISTSNSGSNTTATANVSGTEPDNIFIKVSVSQSED